MMKYYIYKAGNANGSLIRVDMDSNPVVLERLLDGKWVFSPAIIGITGLGSNGDAYVEITEQEARKIEREETS